MKLLQGYFPAILVFLSVATAAEPGVVWTSGFPSAGESVIRDAVELQSGSVIAVGETSTGVDGSCVLNILGLKDDGSLLWERSILSMGTSGGARLLSGLNCCYVCGYQSDSLASQGFVMKIDTLGNTEWLVSEGYPEDDGFTDMCFDAQGNIIAVGYSFNSETRDRDVFAACFTDSGTVLWKKRFIEAGFQTATAVATAPVNGSGIFITGTDGSDIFLMKIDQSGDWEWKTRHFHQGTQTSSDILPIAEGGYLVTGSTGNPNGFSDALLVIFDSAGEVSSEFTWGESGPDKAYTVMELPPAGFVILFNSNPGDGTGYGSYLARFDPWFAKVWQIEIPGNNSLCYSARPASDGGFLISGKYQPLPGSGVYSSRIVRLSGEDLFNWE